jgi:selenocysteine-specific elongation factor
MKSHTIIGTAGHIDHGKTSLIKALTGIDTDRLKEEKERGMTIDLGFAHWLDTITIIDVPGHERFIRNMVAGVSTIDFFLFVIAADDGIMPQTIEHLDILKILKIRKGMVVITKIDLVEPDWLDLVLTDVQELLQTYDLPDLPVFKVSTVTGQGIPELKEQILAAVETLSDRSDDKPFRMTIDRSFTMKGFGTVVTGTVLNGTAGKGKQVDLLPRLQTVTIRGVQRHTRSVQSVRAGDRAAINLQSISKGKIARGDQLTDTDSLRPASDFLGILHTVSQISLQVKNNCKITVHSGTAVRTGKLLWYDDQKYLRENHNYHVRILLDQPMVVTRYDAFLTRSHSPVHTLGGGTVLEATAADYPAVKKEWQGYFAILESNNIHDVIELYIKSSGYTPLPFKQLASKLFESPQILKSQIQQLQQNDKIRELTLKGQLFYVHNTIINRITDKVLAFLHAYHDKYPLNSGAGTQEIIHGTDFLWLDPELIQTIIKLMLENQQIKQDGQLYALPAFSVKLNTNFQTVKQSVMEIFLNASFSPPSMDELLIKFDLNQEELHMLCRSLEREQLLVHIQNFYIHIEAWRQLLSFLKDYFQKDDHLPVPELKNFLQTSRKFAIPILEYLDTKQYTKRKGDFRIAGTSLF